MPNEASDDVSPTIPAVVLMNRSLPAAKVYVLGREAGSAVVVALVLGTVIIAAMFGNCLVIASVSRFRRLRSAGNAFIVSLAVADLLVAGLVMPFSAVQEVTGRWPFGQRMCDVFNGNDVLFSTASLLHLCCISVDRYVAVTDPFAYERRICPARVARMLTTVWTVSTLLSHVPIHSGWYAANRGTAVESEICSFDVNTVYALVSSGISFWTPATVMVFAYIKIYREARAQEQSIMTLRATSVVDAMNRRFVVAGTAKLSQRFQSDNKAAKTLGIILGAFLVCWLPFFVWYLMSTLCGSECGQSPASLVSTLFWVGYCNSVLNPVIYAAFNRDFRRAFQTLLRVDRCRQDSQFGVAAAAAPRRTTLTTDVINSTSLGPSVLRRVTDDASPADIAQKHLSSVEL